MIHILISDINECLLSNACGVNALCGNYAGNYTCSCQDGYTGNPYDGVRLFFNYLPFQIPYNT